MLLMLFSLLLFGDDPFPIPAIDFAPRQYAAHYTTSSPTIDGKLDDAVWQKATWSKLFVDIEGPSKKAPIYDTRMAMTWDDTYLYVAARLEDPHIWAKLKERDSIIFYDNDFEVFIDPDGDTHEYYELEINAFGTAWDLFLSKPYRDDGAALHDWNLPNLKVAINVEGTINDPSDQDEAWTTEIAFAWKDLKVCAGGAAPPKAGDVWRMNFSRVQWHTQVVGNEYQKKKDPKTGKDLPEQNWVWSPQGLVNMHYPEMWGFVQFVKEPAPSALSRAEVDARWQLRRLYYAQRRHHQKAESFGKKISELLPKAAELEAYNWPPTLHTTPHFFEAVLEAKDKSHSLHISHDGRIWRK